MKDNRYFVYKHTRLDTNEIFYIGVGTKPLNPQSLTFNELHRRAYLKACRNPFWMNITSKTNYKVEIVEEFSSYEKAELKEIELIALYGRRELGRGTLVNMTDGGKGQRNVFNRHHSQETKDKMSKAAEGVPKSESHKEALSKAKLANPVRFWKGKKFSEEHKQKLRKPKKKKYDTNTRTTEICEVNNGDVQQQ